MTYVDYAKQAEDYRREVSRDYYRARKYAKAAAREYQFAKDFRRTVRLIAASPVLWLPDHTPADYERYARVTERLADTYLNSSFSAHDRARFHAGLAREYTAMAERADERLERTRERLAE